MPLPEDDLPDLVEPNAFAAAFSGAKLPNEEPEQYAARFQKLNQLGAFGPQGLRTDERDRAAAADDAARVQHQLATAAERQARDAQVQQQRATDKAAREQATQQKAQAAEATRAQKAADAAQVKQWHDAGIMTRTGADGKTVQDQHEDGRIKYKPGRVSEPELNPETGRWERKIRDQYGSVKPLDLVDNGEMRTDKDTGETFFNGPAGERVATGRDDHWDTREAAKAERAKLVEAQDAAHEELRKNAPVFAPVKAKMVKQEWAMEKAKLELTKAQGAAKAAGPGSPAAMVVGYKQAAVDALKPDYDQAKREHDSIADWEDGIKNGIADGKKKSKALALDIDKLKARSWGHVVPDGPTLEDKANAAFEAAQKQQREANEEAKTLENTGKVAFGAMSGGATEEGAAAVKKAADAAAKPVAAKVREANARAIHVGKLADTLKKTEDGMAAESARVKPILANIGLESSKLASAVMLGEVTEEAAKKKMAALQAAHTEAQKPLVALRDERKAALESIAKTVDDPTTWGDKSTRDVALAEVDRQAEEYKKANVDPVESAVKTLETAAPVMDTVGGLPIADEIAKLKAELQKRAKADPRADYKAQLEMLDGALKNSGDIAAGKKAIADGIAKTIAEREGAKEFNYRPIYGVLTPGTWGGSANILGERAKSIGKTWENDKLHWTAKTLSTFGDVIGGAVGAVVNTAIMGQTVAQQERAAKARAAQDLIGTLDAAGAEKALRMIPELEARWERGGVVGKAQWEQGLDQASILGIHDWRKTFSEVTLKEGLIKSERTLAGAEATIRQLEKGQGSGKEFWIALADGLLLSRAGGIYIADENNPEEVAMRAFLRNKLGETIGKHAPNAQLFGSATGSLAAFFSAGGIAGGAVKGAALKGGLKSAATMGIMGADMSFGDNEHDMGWGNRLVDILYKSSSLYLSELLGDKLEHRVSSVNLPRWVPPRLAGAGAKVAGVWAGETLSDVAQSAMDGKNAFDGIMASIKANGAIGFGMTGAEMLLRRAARHRAKGGGGEPIAGAYEGAMQAHRAAQEDWQKAADALKAGTGDLTTERALRAVLDETGANLDAQTKAFTNISHKTRRALSGILGSSTNDIATRLEENPLLLSAGVSLGQELSSVYLDDANHKAARAAVMQESGYNGPDGDLMAAPVVYQHVAAAVAADLESVARGNDKLTTEKRDALVSAGMLVKQADGTHAVTVDALPLLSPAVQRGIKRDSSKWNAQIVAGAVPDMSHLDRGHGMMLRWAKTATAKQAAAVAAMNATNPAPASQPKAPATAPAAQGSQWNVAITATTTGGRTATSSHAVTAPTQAAAEAAATARVEKTGAKVTSAKGAQVSPAAQAAAEQKPKAAKKAKGPKSMQQVIKETFNRMLAGDAMAKSFGALRVEIKPGTDLGKGIWLASDYNPADGTGFNLAYNLDAARDAAVVYLKGDRTSEAQITEAEIVDFIEAGLREELIHFAQYTAIRERWVAGQKNGTVKGPFVAFLKAHYAELHAALNATDEGKKQLAAMRKLYGVDLPEWKLLMEGTRQLVQLAKEGKTTETVTEWLRKYFAAALDVLRKLAGNPAAQSKHLDATIKDVEAVLAGLEEIHGENEKTDANTNTPPTPATKTESVPEVPQASGAMQLPAKTPALTEAEQKTAARRAKLKALNDRVLGVEADAEDLKGGTNALNASPAGREDLRAAVVEQRKIPKELRADFMDMGDELFADGIDTPEKFAAEMEAVSGASIRPFIGAIWRAVGAGLEGAAAKQWRDVTDWAEIYGKLGGARPGTALDAEDAVTDLDTLTAANDAFMSNANGTPESNEAEATIKRLFEKWKRSENFGTATTAFSAGFSGFLKRKAAEKIPSASANESGTSDAESRPAPSEPMDVSKLVAARLMAGEALTRKRAHAWAAEAGLDPKQADEWIELGTVMAARRVVEQGRAAGQTDAQIMARLVKLYADQPNLTSKTSESKINQAYSTPAPIAFLASRLAQVKAGERVLDAAAGNGMLFIETAADNAVANELDPKRRARLEALGIRTTTRDATEATAPAKVDKVIVNPPFGSVMGEDGQNRRYDLSGTDETTTQIDHAIALRALESLPANGRATLILGGRQGSDEARMDGYMAGQQRAFWKALYEQYGVVDHFTISGDLYSKQGAGWPIDVVMIRGRKATDALLPSANAPRIISTWEELSNELNDRTDDDRIAQLQGDAERDAAALRKILGGSGSADSTDGGREQDVQLPGTDSTQAGAESGIDGQGAVDGMADGTAGALPAADSGRGSVPRSEAAAGTRGAARDGDGADLRAPDSSERVEKAPSLQVAYSATSKSPSLQTLAPVNMANAMKSAMDKALAEIGDFDTYVHAKLGYKKGQDIGKYFGAEQVDALAMAIYNAERGFGFVLGDQTGIGKGRVAAGMIAYAHERGLTPVFVTKANNLYPAMMSDMEDIGKGDLMPFFTNNADVDFVDGSGRRHKPGAGTAESLRSVQDGLPSGTNVIFTTYSQLNLAARGFTETPAQAASRKAKGEMRPFDSRAEYIERISPGAFFILDESHLAGGDSEAGHRMAHFLRNAAGAYYSSATFTKKPENIAIYYKTALGSIPGITPEELVETMNAGGVPLQQVVSQQLAESGQYMRRERSFDGIPFNVVVDTENAERDKALADDYTKGIRTIMEVSGTMEKTLSDLNKVIRNQSVKLGATGAPKLESTEFGEKIHNFVSQYLLAIKAKTVADKAIEVITRGVEMPDGTRRKHKVVVAVQNTMEGPISAMREAGMPLNFNSMLQRSLNDLRTISTGGGFQRKTSFVVERTGPLEYEKLSTDALFGMMLQTYTETNNEGKPVKKTRIIPRVMNEIIRRALNDQLVAAERVIDGLLLGDMPMSPIDYIRQRVEAAGIKTAEITGRSEGIDKNGKSYKRTAKEASKPGQLKAMSDFNNSDVDFIILNQSGSTGISLHASEKFKRKDPRMMIVAQGHLDINEYMQMLGRIHRSGQVELPYFMPIQSSLPAEIRPASIMSKKMAKLNANTTSNGKSAMTGGMSAPDVLNKYGDDVTYAYLQEDPAFARMLGQKKLLANDGTVKNRESLDEVFTEEGQLTAFVTGKMAILPIEEQEEFWRQMISRYTAQIQYLNETGQNDMEVQTIDAKAQTLSVEPYTVSNVPNPKTAFDEPSNIETVRAVIGRMPEGAQTALQMGAEAAEKYAGLQEIARQGAATTMRDTIEKAKAKSITEWTAQREDGIKRRIGAQYAKIIAAVRLIGEPVTLKLAGGDGYGVVTDVKYKPEAITTPGEWVFKITTNTSHHTLNLPASQFGDIVSGTTREGFAEVFEETAERANTRQIITGNLLAAFQRMGTGTKARVISYTTEDGQTKNGILMPASFQADGGVSQAGEKIETAQQLLQAADWLRIIQSSDGDVRVTRNKDGQPELRVPSARARGGKFWRNPVLNRLMVGGLFHEKGAWMIGEITDLSALYDWLRENDVTLFAKGADTVQSRTDSPAAGESVRLWTGRVKAFFGGAVPSVVRVVDGVEDADVEAYADFDQESGKLVGIVINARAMNSVEDVDRVLTHELGHVAWRDADLSRLVGSLTAAEQARIAGDVELLGYPEGHVGEEIGVRGLEALAGAWKARSWFGRAVGNVMAWANKLGMKLTRRAAESIAARAIAKAHAAVRSMDDARPKITGRNGVDVVQSRAKDTRTFREKADAVLEGLSYREANGGGYREDFSKSNRAAAAESSGRFPASRIAEILGVPTAFIKENAPRGSEWHHTSKFYNATPYYDLDQVTDWLEGTGDYEVQGNEATGGDTLAEWRMKEKQRKGEAPDVLTGQTVKVLEWSGTRNHPKATEVIHKNVTITRKPGQTMVTVTGKGVDFKKGLDTKGFEIQDGGKWQPASWYFNHETTRIKDTVPMQGLPDGFGVRRHGDQYAVADARGYMAGVIQSHGNTFTLASNPTEAVMRWRALEAGWRPESTEADLVRDFYAAKSRYLALKELRATTPANLATAEDFQSWMDSVEVKRAAAWAEVVAFDSRFAEIQQAVLDDMAAVAEKEEARSIAEKPADVRGSGQTGFPAKKTGLGLKSESPAPTRAEGVRLADSATEATSATIRREGEQSVDNVNGENALNASPATREPFFSKLTRTVQGLGQAVMTVAQARAAVTQGAKKDEVAMSGILTDPLSPLVGKADGEKVTREELVGFALEREATVEDVVLAGNDRKIGEVHGLSLRPNAEESEYVGEPMFDVVNAQGRALYTAGERDARQYMEEEYMAGRVTAPEDETHFSQYQLPGADEGSYREMFVTWPESQALAESAKARDAERIWPGNPNARRNLDMMPWLRKTNENGSWSDGHPQYSDITNPIVRIRRNIRTDAEGRRTYFIEEMQGPGKGEQDKMPQEIRKRIYEIGMKRALRDAAEVGADAIGWTTGEQQAARYSLEKHISRLSVAKLSDGSYDLEAYGLDGRRLTLGHGIFNAEDLEGVVGKEMAGKITADLPHQTDNGISQKSAFASPRKEYSGIDLKVGGEGLKRLYDVTLPSLANDLAKKFGVKVGRMAVPIRKGPYSAIKIEGRPGADPSYEIRDAEGRRATGGFGKLESAEKWISENPIESTSVHSLPIPSALREQQMSEGNSLYASPAHGDLARDREYMAAVDRGDMKGAQRMVDAAAKLMGYRMETWRGEQSGRAHTDFKGRHEPAIFTSQNKEFAKEYTNGRGEPRRFYVKADRVLDLANPGREESRWMRAWGAQYEDDGGWRDRESGDETTVEDVIAGGALFDYEGDWSSRRWKDLQRAAKADGYDVLIAPDKGDAEESISTIILKDGNIKSADPVTRDAAGNVIPLSERFNAEQDNILYASPAHGDLARDRGQVAEERDATLTEPENPLKGERLGSNVADVIAKMTKGRKDLLERYAPGAADAITDSEIGAAMKRAALRELLGGINAEIDSHLGKADRKAFVAELLPTAARLNAIGYDANNELVFGEFEMRAGTLNEKIAAKLGKGSGDTYVGRDGETLRIGAYLEDLKAYQLHRTMTEARQQALYRDFTNRYPATAHYLESWIQPGQEDARVTDSRGVVMPTFNRHALRKFFGEASPFGELDEVEGYVPEISRTRSLAGMLVAGVQNMLNKNWKSGAREYKSGDAREHGQVKDLFTAFGIRALEAYAETERRATAEALLEKAVFDVPADGIVPNGWVRCNPDNLAPFTKAFASAHGMDAKALAKLSAAIAAGDTETMKKLVGAAWSRLKETKMVKKEVIAELIRPLTDKTVRNWAIRILDSVSKSYIGGLLTHPFSWITNMGSNELFKLMRIAQRSLYGATIKLSGLVDKDMAREGVQRGGNVALREAWELTKGLITARKWNQAKIDAIVAPELFEGNTSIAGAVSSITEDQMTAGDLLKRANVPAAILKAVGYSNMDVRAKQALAHASYMAQAQQALADYERSSGVKVPKTQRAQWMTQWLHAAGPEVSRRAHATAVAYAMDYENIPWWMDEKVSSVEMNILRRLVLPFIKWPYNMARQMKRFGVDSALDVAAWTAGRTVGRAPGIVGETARAWQSGRKASGAKVANSVAHLATFALMYAAMRALLAAAKDDDEVGKLGRSFDQAGDRLGREWDTSSRVNITDVPLLGTVVGALSKMHGDTGENDYWLRTRNVPYASFMMAMAASLDAVNASKEKAPGRKSDALEGWKSFVGDFWSEGVLMSAMNTIHGNESKYTQGQGVMTTLGGLSADLGFSRVAPVPLLSALRDIIDPKMRRLNDSDTLGYNPGFIEGLESRIPGLSKNLPPKGTIRTMNAENALPELAKLADEPNASKLHADPKTGKLKATFVDPKDKRDVPRWKTLLRLAGANVKPINRDGYKAAVKDKDSRADYRKWLKMTQDE